MTTRQAVRAEGLRKRYGRKNALDGVDFAVPEGTVCGLLGPNGAGKTTAVRILGTLLRADGGRAFVAGFDVARRPAKVRDAIGFTGQDATVDDVLTGRENLRMWGRLHHLGARRSRERATELLDLFDLSDAADQRVAKYSGGMRRRLDLAVGFLRRPSVLFLDEPTTGLDPRGRADVWRAVRTLVAEGTTVLLTTQYLEEADRLADRIVVLDGGRVVAQGPPERLKSMAGGDRVSVVLPGPERLAEAAALLKRVCGEAPDVDDAACRLDVPAPARIGTLTEVLRAFTEADLPMEDVGLRRPTLDEAFLRLTGHHVEVGA